MGTQRVEAFLHCDHLALSGDDYAFMLVVCQKWNDRQIRSLEIGALYLLSLLPCRKNIRPDDSLNRHLRRLQDMQVISVRDNGARYLEKRWLKIDIIDEKWWQYFEEQKEKAKSRDLQQSRGVQPRPAATRSSSANSRSTAANRDLTRSATANSRSATAPTREHKEVERSTTYKDQFKGTPAGVQGDVSESADYSAIAEKPPRESPAPKPALVLSAAIAEADTAASVFNTLELPPQQFDADQEAWQAVVDEMAMVMPQSAYHSWLHGQTEFVGSSDGKFVIRTESAFVRDWLHSRLKKKMELALRAKTGRSVEVEFLTSSQIVNETNGNDSLDKPETLQPVQADQASRPALHPSGRS